MRAISLSLLLFTLSCAHHVETDLESGPIVWPPPPEKARITWLEMIDSSDYAEPPSGFQSFVWSLVGRSNPEVRFKKPFGVTSDSRGRVFVSDTGWEAVLVFDKANGKFGWRGRSGRGQLNSPLGMETDQRDHLFVADAELQRVYEYGPDGEFLSAIGAGVLERPSDVAILEDKAEIWVVDSALDGIATFDFNGQHLRTIGNKGAAPGEFSHPTHIGTLPRSGDVFVADTMNFRVQTFDRDGGFVGEWGQNGDCLRCFSRVKGVALDSVGHVYVVDAAFNNVRIFQPGGELLLFFGEGGNLPGQLWLPSSIHIDENDRIYVVSQYSWRVNVYQYTGAD